MDWADRLVGAARERRPQPLSRSERTAVAVTALAFAAAAAAILALVPARDDVDWALVAALTLGYAVISQVEFEIGAGSAVPEALLFVPLLFLAPLPAVPLIVAAAFVIARVPEFVTRRTHVDRWLYCVADAWFTVGPVVVIAALAPGRPDMAYIDVYALAFLAQGLTGIGSALLMERAGIGASYRDTLQSALWSFRVDAVLWPVGLMAAVAAVDMPLTLVAIAPLVWLLSVFSRERRQRYAAALELNRAYRGTVMLLSDVVEADDNYTADHCRSVVELVCAVADELGVPPADRQELEFAALLHDVGKIAIPNEILNKPGKLSAPEFELMKTHTIEGQQMLDRVGGMLARVGAIVRSCHERWDGKGYPDGLMGQEIPLAARIVFACDAYNAMTTNRPYRMAMSQDAAVAELRGNAGTQFDPWIVAGLIAVVERTPGLTCSTQAADEVRAVISQHAAIGALEPAA